MQFPERPTGNGWQLFGQALGQGAGVLDKYAADVSEEEKRKNVLQELVARRTAAALEQQRQAREDQMREIQFTQSQEKYKQDKDKADRQDKQAKEYRDYVGAKTETKPATKAPILGPGFGPNGETEMTVPAEFSPVPRTREELAMKALELEQISPDKYLDDTKPATGLSLEDRLAMIAAQGQNRAPQRDRFSVQEIGGRKVQVNLDTKEQTDLGPITKKPSGKDILTAKTKLQTLTLAQQQLKQIQDKFAGIQNSYSAGPGGGMLPTQDGKAFDAAVDAFRNTLTGLTRVPGVGAQSDFEAKLSQAPLPKRGEYESVTAQKIQQLNDLVSTLNNGYSGLLQDSEGEADAGAEAPPAEKPTLSARDKQAILWARKNPTDPRAADILQKNGMAR